MPTPYPTHAENGTLVDLDYWNVGELAAMFHMSQATVRRRIRSGEWVVFEPLPGVYLMSAEQIADAVAGMTHKVVPPPPDLPEGGPPVRLGIPLTDTELEGIR